MKKMKLAMIALVLALVMAMPAVVMANYVDEVPTRVENGETFVALRLAAYARGLEVEWDGENMLVTLVGPYGDDLTFAVEMVGGFIEDGMSWVPYEMIGLIFSMIPMEALAEPSRTDQWQWENFEDVREASFSTDLSHGEISLGFIEYMSDNLYSRTPFTYRELEAAIWIVEELLAMGYDWDAIEVQEFSFYEIVALETVMGASWASVTSPWMLGEGTPRAAQLSQNVILTVPGYSDSARKIIVGAHYDTPPYPGASDNASGTALLLESAQRMLEMDNYHTIVYVFFGAEEVGLMGAFFYYDSLTYDERDNIIFMANADVLFEGPYFIYGTGMAPELNEEEMIDVVFELFEMWGFNLEDAAPEFDLMDNLEDFVFNAAMMGLIEPVANEISVQVDAIAIEVQYLHDIELVEAPLLVFGHSDNLVFVQAGHTVVNMFGLERVEDPDNFGGTIFANYFTVGLLHSPLDEFHYIEYTMPGLMYDAMRAFSLFLEGLLLARF
ncbi:MAG: M28 family peptidase [Defluviitaleaceae bacterium]|nr:M28 family peptidase [Defluviitaleaceae bacterium]